MLVLFAAITMTDYLFRPKIRKNATMVKGDKYLEGQAHELHVTPPAAYNTAIPKKSEAMKKVEVADENVLAAKDRKKEQAAAWTVAKVAVKLANGTDVSKPKGRTKRHTGASGSARPSKKRNLRDSPLLLSWILLNMSLPLLP